MKILQINTWVGHIMEPMLNFIEQQKPDIICAQEVFSSDLQMPPFENVRTLELMKKAGEFEDVFFAPTFSFKLCEADVNMGNAILSKFPLHERNTVFVNGQFQKHRTFDNFERNTRNVQTCIVKVDRNKSFNLANHHGFHDVNPLGVERTKQCMETVVQTLLPLKDSLIFCGDLNIKPDSPVMSQLETLGLRNLSVESKLQSTLSVAHRAINRNDVVCDYIFVSDDVKVTHFSMSETLVSDHNALLLEFDL